MRIVEKQSAMAVLIEALAEQIGFARDNQLPTSVRFLEMAKFDLEMQLHDIRKEEVRALCEALQRPRVPALRAGNPRRQATRRSPAKAETREPETFRPRRRRRSAVPLAQAAAVARSFEEHAFMSLRHDDETSAS
jgi:hypothetical protein